MAIEQSIKMLCDDTMFDRLCSVCRDMVEEIMDDEDEVADLNLSSRPLREERQRLRERLRLERGMARSHWHAEASDAASPSSQRPSAARFSHGGGGNGAWLQLQPGSDGGGGEEGPNGAGHRGEDSPRFGIAPC